MIECNLPAKSFEFFARKRQQWSIKVREGIGLFEQKQMPLGRKSMWGKKKKKKNCVGNSSSNRSFHADSEWHGDKRGKK